jgi:hypothetical protein
MRTSYTDAGVAVDGCSTLIDTEVGITRKTTTAVRVAPRIYRKDGTLDTAWAVRR